MLIYNYEFEIIKNRLKLPINRYTLDYKLFKKDIRIDNTFQSLHIEDMINHIKKEITEINLFLNDKSIKNKYNLF